MRARQAALLGAMMLPICACGPVKITQSSETSSTETSMSSGPSEAEAAETEAGGEETDSGFLPLLDHASEECDQWQQDCPEGDKCVPYASRGDHWDAKKCVPVTGDQTPGEPCTYDGIHEGTDDCDASGMCWYVGEVDGEMLGSCVAFCQGTHDDPKCDDGYYCPISGDGVLNICLALCDPLAPDCDDGLGCYWANSAFTCVFTNENIAVGEPCGYINDCEPGLMCTTAEVMPDCAGSACCAAFCDVWLPDTQCDGLPGTACVSFFEEGWAPPGFEHVGLCIVP